MAMFSAHFDESGTPDKDTTALTVAGCVSSVKKWVRFEAEWNKILADVGLPKGTVFRMNRFARNIKPYDGEPFLRSEDKADFFAKLVACVKRNVNKAFSCTVNLRDWERANGLYEVAEHLGYPYPFCGRNCVGQVVKWAKHKGGIPVEVFFEDGAKHRGQLERLLKANDGIGPLFQPKDKMIQFQAADLLAWKSRKVLTLVFRFDGPKNHDAYENVMRSLQSINSIPHDYGVHVYESLERLCIRAGIPRRRR